MMRSSITAVTRLQKNSLYGKITTDVDASLRKDSFLSEYESRQEILHYCTVAGNGFPKCGWRNICNHVHCVLLRNAARY